MAKKKLTKAEKIALMPPETISKLKGDAGRKELIGYLRTMRSSYKRRVGAFKRKGLYSYAQESFEKTRPPKEIQLTKMTRNQMLFEFFRYAAFFNSDTSSEAGIREVNKNQDIRIFGKDERGRPKHTLNQEERRAYWDLYDEFKNLFPHEAISLYSSESIQQFLGDAMYGENIINTQNKVLFLEKLRQRLHQQKELEELENVPNQFSGRGSLFKF